MYVGSLFDFVLFLQMWWSVFAMIAIMIVMWIMVKKRIETALQQSPFNIS